ncbi:nuclease-related domain-containing DEAD/DEAH box helicase [Nocardioides okcheonensis]|uniref:nuclease-related domain-containing DEAD/DEAH box helicase n=1 Tax=Nocardioides okcheonensis TaxID=2894081 RepID=UPI001E4FBC68|nr:NERD domain-containing protein [Nocardioides okcheonensis]UFN44831.1 AAA family ATPase [Nocardioides okcheonensis]
MARFFPSRLMGSKVTYGERMVFERLHDLDDSWVVLSELEFLHGREKGSRLREGEADFVLLHPKRGLLLLEVKDARYRVEGRQWYRLPKSGAESKDRSPFIQARDNRHRIDKMLVDAGVRMVPSGYAVFFTAGRPSGRLGPEAPSEIVVTRDQFDDVPVRIQAITSHWAAGSWKSPQDFELAVRTLSPTVVMDSGIDYQVDVSIGELDRLTNAQVALTHRQLEAVRATAAVPRSLVLGAAGTGKTFVGYSYARERARAGMRVAVVGTPSQLRLVTRRKLTSQGIICGEPYDVLSDIYGSAVANQYLGASLWETALDLVEKHGPRIDCLIVDEAQSLDSDLLESMGELVTEDGQVVLLADPYQKDSSGTWRPPGTFETFWLTENCRNTLPIARVVSRVAGMQTPANGAPGGMPVFKVGKSNFWDFAVNAISSDLQKLAPSDIAVLTRTAPGARRAYEALQRGGFRASTRLSSDRISVFCIEEFRGCEAKYVAYLAEDYDSADMRTIDYLSVSRACGHLVIVVEDAAPWTSLQHLFEPQEWTE